MSQLDWKVLEEARAGLEQLRDSVETVLTFRCSRPRPRQRQLDVLPLEWPAGRPCAPRAGLAIELPGGGRLALAARQSPRGHQQLFAGGHGLAERVEVQFRSGAQNGPVRKMAAAASGWLAAGSLPRGPVALGLRLCAAWWELSEPIDLFQAQLALAILGGATQRVNGLDRGVRLDRQVPE